MGRNQSQNSPIFVNLMLQRENNMFPGVPRMNSGKIRIYLLSGCRFCDDQKHVLESLTAAELNQLELIQVTHAVQSGPVKAFPTTITPDGKVYEGSQPATKLRGMIRQFRK